MTTTTAPTTKNHPDGGTYTVIAFAETRDRWAIAITKWTTYRNDTRFEVYRVSDDNKMLRLHKATTEAEARAFANTAWKQDR